MHGKKRSQLAIQVGMSWVPTSETNPSTHASRRGFSFSSVQFYCVFLVIRIFGLQGHVWNEVDAFKTFN